MDYQSLENILRDCTVKLSVPGRNTDSGTGFFVAPRLILTCSHVVKNVNHDKVQVCWRKQVNFEATIKERSSSKFDLALLEFHPLENFPCVYLDDAFQANDNLYTYGYTDDFPRGSSVTGKCEGIAEDKNKLSVIKFKGGQIRPGLSGSPLLNQRTGKVCGIVKFTRDRSLDLGGGAVSTKDIFDQFPQLEELQRDFHNQNDQWKVLLPPPYEINNSKFLFSLLFYGNEIISEIPKRLIFFIKLIGLIGILMILYGFSVPVEVTGGLVFRNIGLLLIIILFFYIAFYISAKYLRYGNQFIINGILAGGTATIIGAILYSFCYLTNSKCLLYTGEALYLFEKFGRFVFLGYPLTIGCSITVCSIINLLENFYKLVKNQNNKTVEELDNLKKEQGVIAIIFFIVAILFAFIALVSGSISELGLAKTDSGKICIMGDTNIIPSALLGFISYLIIFALQKFWYNWRVIGRGLVSLIQPITIVLYFFIVIARNPLEQSSNIYFLCGTGLGVIVTYSLAAFSLLAMLSIPIYVLIDSK